MNFAGPWHMDLQAPLRTAQEMVRDFSRGQMKRFANVPNDTGAWLVLQDGALVGFWLVFGDSYLDEGSLSRALPPYARAFLEALTEEIWWSRLVVASQEPEVFEPIVVLEWPAHLSARSERPPPGIRSQEEETVPIDSEGSWLEPTVVEHEALPTERIPVGARLWLQLPKRRGHLTLIRGHLERTQRDHRASWEVVQLSDPTDNHPRGEPLQHWLVRAQTELALEEPDEDRLLYPVLLEEDRVAFPLGGWLDRELRLSPTRWEERAKGVLPMRDVSNPLVAQSVAALSVLGAVVVIAFGFAGALYWLSIPPAPPTVSVAEAAARPALSICSESHEGFRREFRCQLQSLAASGEIAPKGTCSDLSEDDLRPTFCGLRDRNFDDAFLGDQTFARTAAAQACFNVLGQPYTHQRTGQPDRADPRKFFDDPESRLRPLSVLSTLLDHSCDVYGSWIRERVRGTLLATYLGSESPLEELLAERAAMSLRQGEKQCFDAGRASSYDPELDAMCGDQSAPLEATLPTDFSTDTRKQMAETTRDLLGTSQAPKAIEQYLISRYQSALANPASPVRDPVFACYRNLVVGNNDARVDGAWDLSVVAPQALDRPAGTSQLQLDAALFELRDSESPSDDPCWEVMEDLVAGYTPVHPLTGEAARYDWPSEEQQLCGQVCAGRYRLIDQPDSWATPELDVATCVSESPPEPSPPGLDRLSLPWNASIDDAWVAPNDDSVCAFHLVAQGWIPDVLPADMGPQYWAGKAGTGIAGGADGVAARAAKSLSSYGGSRTTAYCAAVAAQCYAEDLVMVLGDGAAQPYEWRRMWDARGSKRNPRDLDTRPWCRLIWPHLTQDGIKSGDLDYPCALGVTQTRERFEATIDRLALDAERGE